MIKGYFLQNWALILILAAFFIMLLTNVFLDRRSVRRLYNLIVVVFLLSIVVYVEFLLADLGVGRYARTVLMAIRYSATPFIIAMVTYTLVKRQHWAIFIPAVALLIIDVISIFTGIVFKVNADNSFTRGALGYLPFIVAGGYCAFLIYILIRRSNKQAMEIIPIVFMSFALVSGVVLPFLLGKEFANIFCTTIGIALFVYYMFLILQLTKKDPLTGLLNRQAYYADIGRDVEDVTALVSIDMNGLKTVNDNEGHVAGDEALVTLSLCFMRALKRRQSCYRVGGDEFVIVCRRNSPEDVVSLVERIKNNVAETKYSCSVGYGFGDGKSKSIDDILKASDEMMYADKSRYYSEKGVDRRKK